MSLEWLWVGITLTLIGLVLGSLANVAIARWPEDRSIVWPLSHCPTCAHNIRPYDNLPVVSWLLLRGRCRDCGTSIAPTYPVVEALGGLVGLLLFLRIFRGPQDIDAAHIAAWCVYYGFLWALMVAAFTDLRHRIIADETSIYAAPFAIVGIAMVERLGYHGWLSISWQQSVVGASGAGLFFASLAIVFAWLMGREALGWGDVKLALLIGAALGPLPGAFLVVLMASIIGSVIGLAQMLWLQQRTYTPFGPSLGLSAAIYVFYGDWIIRRFFPAMQWLI